jgi:hypothetical protein
MAGGASKRVWADCMLSGRHACRTGKKDEHRACCQSPSDFDLESLVKIPTLEIRKRPIAQNCRTWPVQFKVGRGPRFYGLRYNTWRSGSKVDFIILKHTLRK